MVNDNRITLAVTGASGWPYALSLLQTLVKQQQQVFLLISDAAREVVRLETGEALPTQQQDCQAYLRHYCQDNTGLIQLLNNHDWLSCVASGSGAPRRMVICPCSMGTLAAVACGLSNNLIERAADVAIKEHHSLIIVPREMPLSVLHLENMLKLARLGVVVMPASPAFYHQPQSIQDVVDFVVERILKHLGLQGTLTVWGV